MKNPITPKIKRKAVVDENPFKCKKCNEGFKSEKRLSAHDTLAHGVKKPFGIDDSFLSESGLNESFQEKKKLEENDNDFDIVTEEYLLPFGWKRLDAKDKKVRHDIFKLFIVQL